MNRLLQIINEELNNITNGLTLYHGSGKYFTKFSMEHINTGQHSQDFGYGLYFTTNKETATFYANELSQTKTLLDKYKENIKTINDEILLDYANNNYINLAKKESTHYCQKVTQVKNYKTY